MELKGHPDRIEAFRRGDRETLAAVYGAHVRAVEEMLRRGFTFTSKGATVRFRGFWQPFRLQEAVQDGFMHAFRQRARESYDGGQPYGPFLMAVVRNRVLDELRKEQTYARYVVSASSVAAPEEDPSSALDRLSAGAVPSRTPEMEALSGQLARALGAFLETLSDEDARLVREHLAGELTQQQMADALGESRNDVRKRIRELRAGLLRHLKRAGIIESLDVAEVFRRALVLVGGPL
jgi:RNA polymerase sigma factor (sigma-70 family)